MPLRFFSILLLLVGNFSVGHAQIVDFREWSRRHDESGVSRGQYTFSGTFRTSQTEFAEVNLASPAMTVHFPVPLEGINVGSSLEGLGRRVEGNTAIAFDPFPAFGEEFNLRGLRVADGRVHSWPGEGPHLLFRPEGGVDLYFPRQQPATVQFDDGTSVPLASINGALPGPGEATLYTGTLAAGSLPVSAWPSDIMALHLVSPISGGDIGRHLYDGTGGDRAFRGERLVERSMIRTSQAESVLLFTPPIPEALQTKLQSRPRVSIKVELDDRIRQATAIVPAGRWVVRHGKKVEEVGELDFFQNVVGVDLLRRRLMIMAPMDDSRGGAGIPAEQFARFLEEEGYQHGFQLPGRAPSLLSPLDGGSHIRRAGRLQTRMALVIAPAPQKLTVPDVDGDLFRITGITVEGLRTEFLANPPARLTNELAPYSPGLDQFWAARIPGGGGGWRPPTREPGPAAVRFLMPRPIHLRAMELVHAESAGFSPHFNLKSFRVWGRERSQAPWLLLGENRHDEPVDRERLVLAAAPRLTEVRLEILEPNFLPGGDTARLVEVFFWGPERPLER